MGLGGYNPRTVNENAFHIERDGCEVTLQIEVPTAAIQKKEEELLVMARAKLKVPGFRSGKAPEHLVLRYYGEDEFAQDLRDDLVRDWLSRALDELDLHPVTTPTVETTAFARGDRLAFQAKFAVLPEVTIPDEIAVDVPEPPPAEVTDDEVAGVLAGLRRDAAVLEPKGSPAEEGDVVRLQRADRDWEGEATASRPIGKQLLNAQAEQKLTLVDEDGHSEVFSVTGVYRVLLPTQDEAAQHYGHASWEAFESVVRTELARVAEGRRLRMWRLAALDAVSEWVQVEVPSSLVADVVAEEWKEVRLPPDQKPQFEEAVRRRLRREILAQRLAEARDLRPDEDEVKRRAEGQGRDESVVRAALVLEQAADWIIAATRRKE